MRRRSVSLLAFTWLMLGLVVANRHEHRHLIHRRSLKEAAKLYPSHGLVWRSRVPSSSVNGEEIDVRPKLSRFQTKIGSRPPSCHNKCGRCQPCSPVEVTVPSSHRQRTSIDQQTNVKEEEDPPYYNLAWRCRCRGRYYNP